MGAASDESGKRFRAQFARGNAASEAAEAKRRGSA
jgi:hypothetical protein